MLYRCWITRFKRFFRFDIFCFLYVRIFIFETIIIVKVGAHVKLLFTIFLLLIFFRWCLTLRGSSLILTYFLKSLWSEASSVLYKATKKRAYFGEITILVPKHWNTVTYERALGQTYDKVYVKVTNEGFLLFWQKL